MLLLVERYITVISLVTYVHTSRKLFKFNSEEVTLRVSVPMPEV